MPKKYIDAEKLTKAVREKCDRCEYTRTDFCSTRWCDIAKVIKMIDNAPTADVVERKKGNWENIYGFCVSIGCPVCGYLTCCASNFCPNCGADMREESTDETD